jgi:hypothetical protein
VNCASAAAAALFLALPLSTAHAQSPSHSPAVLAPVALDLIGGLRSGTTLRDWRLSHPRDSVESNVSSDDHGPYNLWCAVVHGSTRAGARDAYFYVPSPGPTMALPIRSPDLRDRCRLGLMTLESAPVDSLESVQTWRADSAALTATLGPVASTQGIAWPLDQDWTRPMVWKRHGASVGTTIESHKTDPARKFTPFLVMSTPMSGMDISWQSLLAAIDTSTVETMFAPLLGQPSINTLIGLAALRESEERVVRAYVKDATATDSVVATIDTARDRRFAEALRKLVRPDPPVSPDQRIGRLLVADWLIDSSSYRVVFWTTDSIARALIGEIGPRLEEDHMGGWVQDHLWLTDALAIGGDGPAANTVFLDAMDHGFDFLAECGRGHQVDNVIERGTTFLASHPASPIRGDVELMLAEGYRDAVSLALGGGYDGDTEAKAYYAPRIGYYRREAIAHFRNAFRLLGPSPRTRFDRADAWRLVAGLDPLSTHFYCIDD